MLLHNLNILYVCLLAVLLNSSQIFEKIFGDELIMDIMGCLECKFHTRTLCLSVSPSSPPNATPFLFLFLCFQFFSTSFILCMISACYHFNSETCVVIAHFLTKWPRVKFSFVHLYLKEDLVNHLIVCFQECWLLVTFPFCCYMPFLSLHNNHHIPVLFLLFSLKVALVPRSTLYISHFWPYDVMFLFYFNPDFMIQKPHVDHGRHYYLQSWFSHWLTSGTALICFADDPEVPHTDHRNFLKDHVIYKEVKHP